MKAFITGITGFVGSHVAELLLGNGDRVLGSSRGDWHPDAPEHVVDNVDLCSWDIVHPASDQLVDAIRAFSPDVIFHFAAISIPSMCGTDEASDYAVDVNVHGTTHLLDLANQFANRPRIVFSSTCHVYRQVTPDAPIVHEKSDLAPVSAYGETKLRCERQIQGQVAAGTLDACIARGFQHIGPRQPSGLMLTDWLEQLDDSDATRMYVRSTNSFLDMVDVRDAARAYLKLANHGVSGEVYNLGSGKMANSGAVLDTLLKQASRQLDVQVGSRVEKWNAIANIDKLAALGWKPMIPCQETIADMLAARPLNNLRHG